MTGEPEIAERALEILDSAVARIDGRARAGQRQMVEAVAESLDSGQHLLIQAGTGTGKSLGYLAPVLAHLTEHPDRRIVIATATLALQAQLAKADIPAAVEAASKVSGRTPRHAILKGRSNYACLLRARDGGTGDQTALFSAADLSATIPPKEAPSELGAEVLALREWVEEQAEVAGLADRDDAPSHTQRGWAQVSVPVRECLGAQRCPYGEECFVERSREQARQSQLVVTNHALLAINAMHGGTALPEHDQLIIDEAHELTSRITSAASAELSPTLIERVGRRVDSYLDDDLAADLIDTGEALRSALDQARPGRVLNDNEAVPIAAGQVRDLARQAMTAMSKEKDPDPERRQAAAAVAEVYDIAERIAAVADADVVWVTDSERFGRDVRVAPLSVAGLLRSKVLSEHTTVLTSATLKLGDSYTAMAGSVGLAADERGERPGDGLWRGIDVGSPFDYSRQGILYTATDLPAPSREGISPASLAEVAELVWAAGGRTLGLFASQRSAEAAAVHVRKQLPDFSILCQGDAHLGELTSRFAAEPQTSLFGTLSLWQGIDVPGDTCQLVIIEKLPFPRPDDPLMQARQQAVSENGGNGFMSVAATQAALLLAQGAGRLIRRVSDRGVVAVLDPRLVTARYGSFLRSSMPPMWSTRDRETVINALRRLAAASEQAA
ncbi:ATP-dependent DNA helicase [Naumannella halotolerans]|uniref:ATP-dependent helicase DinG n=1 Tax=Naumannella halotolerans TaxID=993414 RepID=A0A4R7J9Z1_9ACTN|nr:ATP-dependent DNA helicase [Naumannella halotolerans]TDT33199.1 ATP-dependent DNA helicase DinG [Naumannella halotolerans]